MLTSKCLNSVCCTVGHCLKAVSWKLGALGQSSHMGITLREMSLVQALERTLSLHRYILFTWVLLCLKCFHYVEAVF